ncbi:MAG TPA: ASKHA domain-containing protein [Treponemataceae bacterium]|nr:ASKHA domain-containing protein [Treponemataceae bacterium]
MTVRLTGDGRSTLLELLARAPEGPTPDAPCGGNGTCGKCLARFVSGASEPTLDDRRLVPEADLARGVRLACRAVPLGPCAVELEGSGYRAVSAYRLPTDRSSGKPAHASVSVHTSFSGAGPLAVAIDVGTTTVALELIDRGTGRVLARDARLNGQRLFGADVVSRVNAAIAGNARELRALIARDARLGIASLLAAEGASGSDVGLVTVAANSVMTHLILGLPVDGFARAPFTPAKTRYPPTTFAEAFPLSAEDAGRGVGESSASSAEIAPSCPVAIVPGVSAFVGGDVVSGVAALELSGRDGPELFIDLGTNAEMVLAVRGAYRCASAAAGPAFEGGSISSGTGSVPGAVAAVRIEGSRFAWDLIGGGEPGEKSECRETSGAGEKSERGVRTERGANASRAPLGLCGSGLIDFVACALELGLIARDGALSPVCAEKGVFLDPEGRVRLLQADVRALQLAKAAVRAGISILLEDAGLRAEDVARVYLAGGFGLYLRESSAIAIGLLPAAFAGKTVPVGNTALAGASLLARDPEGMSARFDAMLSQARTVGLAEDPRFERLFIDSMNF